AEGRPEARGRPCTGAQTTAARARTTSPSPPLLHGAARPARRSCYRNYIPIPVGLGLAEPGRVSGVTGARHPLAKGNTRPPPANAEGRAGVCESREREHLKGCRDPTSARAAARRRGRRSQRRRTERV